MILPVPDMSATSSFASIDGSVTAGAGAEGVFGLLVDAVTTAEAVTGQPQSALVEQKMLIPPSLADERGLAAATQTEPLVSPINPPEIQAEVAPEVQLLPIPAESEPEPAIADDEQLSKSPAVEVPDEDPQLPQAEVEPTQQAEPIAPAEVQADEAAPTPVEPRQLASKPAEQAPPKPESQPTAQDKGDRHQPISSSSAANRPDAIQSSSPLNFEQPSAEITDEPSLTRPQPAESAGGQARPPVAERADSNLPSQLLSQALPNVASRPAVSPYPVQVQPLATSPVIVAQPGRLGADMGVEIARAVKGDREDLLIRLDPREMGRIDVRLSFDRDGVLRAVMSADSPAALDLLRRESGDLNRALADAGIRSDGQSLRFDARSGEGMGQGGQRGNQDRHTGSHGGMDSSGSDIAEPPYRPLRASGQVDLIA